MDKKMDTYQESSLNQNTLMEGIIIKKKRETKPEALAIRLT